MKKKIVIWYISHILTNISLKQEEEKKEQQQLRVTGTATPAEDREEEEEKEKKIERGQLSGDTNTRRYFKIVYPKN